MIWTCIGKNVKSQIAICDYGFKINSENYTEILVNYLKPLITRPEIEFLQDNAPSHRSNFTKEWLKKMLSMLFKIILHIPLSLIQLKQFGNI